MLQPIQIVLLLLTFSSTVLSAYDPNAKNNVAAYWGQGANQLSLGAYCETGTFDIVLLSFLNYVNSTLVSFNFGNACWGPECPLIAKDIKKCQKLGIKVLLSMGGDRSLGDFRLGSDGGAESAAQILYDMFNPKGNKNVIKPFGPDVKIDGFDLDVENHVQTGHEALLVKLRELWAPEKLLLTACPQCTFPDVNVNDVMNSSKAVVDIVFLQFYSNPRCSMVYTTFSESWKTWSSFFESVPNKNMKMYVTLQGQKGNKWHVNLTWLNLQMEGKYDAPFFGGFGVWDASVATNTIDDSLGTSMTYLEGLRKVASQEYSSKGKRDEF